jgi:diaminohydroxyphosphoribosylaminopyrimidine deaminase/5-amino-6-(5-phosphoribosylamino)uracil reductase
MRRAIELSRLCPPAGGAYSVGAVIVAPDGTVLAEGWSRENGDRHVHAEEAALAKISDESRLTGATVYSTLEPCTRRASRPVPCAELIRSSGAARVVIAWREPSLFVADCRGVELLTEAGIDVTELTDLADEARAVNHHLGI